MNLKNWFEVSALVTRLQVCRTKLDAVRRGPGLGVTINGQYQDDAFVESVRHHVIRHLEGEEATLLIDLAALDVHDAPDEHAPTPVPAGLVDDSWSTYDLKPPEPCERCGLAPCQCVLPTPTKE